MISLLFVFLLSSSAFAESSTCFGTTSVGKLEGGVKLPGKGSNFLSYGKFPELIGRTYVHSQVKDVIVMAYADLANSFPAKIFKYAETGFKKGGRFKPHKTHQNGLSVDFMVPVINEAGESVHLPTNLLNKYGYSIEFDKSGAFGEYQIDYEALGAHLVSLHKAANKNGIGLWRVIFDPKLQPHLLKTKSGPFIKKNIQLSKKRSWVRHDEHYHVDFKVPCESL